MLAVNLRIAIKSHRATLLKGWQKMALAGIKGMTPFQQSRHIRIIQVAALYFKRGKGVDEIGKTMGFTHQRVSAILGDAVRLLEKHDLIDFGSGVHKPKSRPPVKRTRIEAGRSR